MRVRESRLFSMSSITNSLIHESFFYILHTWMAELQIVGLMKKIINAADCFKDTWEVDSLIHKSFFTFSALERRSYKSLGWWKKVISVANCFKDTWEVEQGSRSKTTVNSIWRAVSTFNLENSFYILRVEQVSSGHMWGGRMTLPLWVMVRLVSLTLTRNN